MYSAIMLMLFRYFGVHKFFLSGPSRVSPKFLFMSSARGEKQEATARRSRMKTFKSRNVCLNQQVSLVLPAYKSFFCQSGRIVQ